MGKPVLDPDDDDGGEIETRVTGGDDGADGGDGADDGKKKGGDDEDRGDVVEGDDGAGGEGGGGEGGEGGGAKDDDGVDDPENLNAILRGGDTIPRARFNEVNEQLQSEREKSARLEGALAERRAVAGSGGDGGGDGDQEQVVDLKALNKQYRELLMEGKDEEADAVLEKINAENRRQAVEEADRRAIQRENTRLLNEAATEVVEEYPFLDSKSKDANKAAIADVVEWRNFYIAKGEAPDVALRKAAKRIAPLYAKDDDGEGGGDGAAAGGKGKGAPDKDAQRTANAAKRAAIAAGAQPPRTPTAGGGRTTRSTEPDPETMSENQFRNMSDEDKRKARGDVVSG